MKHNTNLLIISCAAALLSLGAATTSFAATGWQMEDDTWCYYDSSGSQVTDTWKKSGDNWYYLGSDGDMVYSSLIEDDDDYYYVNSSGAMVMNEWRELDNEDSGEEDEPETCWYYFQSNGKAYTAGSSEKTSFKSIKTASGETKKFAFDSEGKMLFGWVNDSSERVTGDDAWKDGVYYCGESSDGAQVNSKWAYLEAVDEDNDEDDFEDAYWFYFGSNGKKVKDTTKTINGKKYRFDENGAAEFSWYEKTASSSTASSSSSLYYNQIEECWLSVGWFKTVPSESVDAEAYEDDEAYWFYAQKNGELITSQLKTINGQKYAFNDKGEMLHGLYKLTFKGSQIDTYEEIEAESDLPDEDEDCLVYYFGDSPKEGAMKTGKCTIELDGEKYTYNFKKSGSDKGAGYDGINDGYIYIKGRLLKADSDEKYKIVTYKDKDYLIGTSGQIAKNKKNIKDADDTYYCTDKNGIVTYQGDEKK